MNKQGASKFDAALADKTQGAQAAQQVNAAQATQATQAAQQVGQVQRAGQVQGVQKTEKAELNKVTREGVEAKSQAQKPGTDAQKSNGMMTQVVSSLEQGQMNLEKLISQASSGKQFSNSELLGLQASMYKYTQELDLTSKVVEKATSGLKDTLKTQV